MEENATLSEVTDDITYSAVLCDQETDDIVYSIFGANVENSDYESSDSDFVRTICYYNNTCFK